MDHYYAYPEERIREVKEAKPWCLDAKYFKKVKISPSACVKMLTHGQSGVDKGISQSGKPVEVMGLLLGRPDTEDLRTIIISDAMPMPCEGFETRVVVDDENVINYMIDMGESIEMTRQERFCGWYHTHPFDLDGTTHCYMSNTDVSTQLAWQRSEDKHGNHWLAIVIDPLLSVAQGRPEMMAFRVYPPEFSAPKDETPDGTLVREERSRVEQWGACWNRYYRLEIDYFMSSLAADTLRNLRTQLLWSKGFTTAPQPEDETKLQNQLSTVANRLEHAAGTAVGRGTKGRPQHFDRDESVEERTSVATTGGLERDVRGLNAASNLAAEICNTRACTLCGLLVKKALFCAPSDEAGAVEELKALHRALQAAQQGDAAMAMADST
jgi:COP9 signalosome complex subunit 5